MAETSPGNPCPYLRALAAHGCLAADVLPVAEVSDTVVRVAAAGDGAPALAVRRVRLIALVANGLGPVRLWRTARRGLRINELRGGPLDKRGAGSRIIDQHGEIDYAELERLAGFASEKRRADGTAEPGLDRGEITRFMDANFARARGHRRPVDRRLMEGEFPVLLTVIGRDGPDGRYLPLVDLFQLFTAQRLPQRMLDRLARRNHCTPSAPRRR